MASLFMAALATSCSEDLSVGNTHTASLTASVTAEQTRAAFLSDGSFYWSAGDQIGVLTTNSEKLFSALDLKTGAGTASATFEGDISGKIGAYAVYPYSIKHEMNGTTLTYDFPATYSYTKVDQTYFPEGRDGNSYNPAMWAKIANNSVIFKHLGGVFMIKIAEMPSASGTLVFSSSQNLCGKYTADVSKDQPQLKNTESNVADAGTEVTISFSGAEVGKPGIFYVPVPTGYYDAYLTLKDGNGDKTIASVVAGSFNIQRRDLQTLTISKVTIDAGVATEVENVAGASTELANNDNIAVKEVASGESTIEVPAITTNAAKTVSLEKVADNATVTLEDQNTAEGGNSVKEITLSVPNNANADKAPIVVVKMPNSTVTLAGNAGTATYNEVTSSTAENTLVISNGVTVKKLIIAKGNVRVNKGATVEAIELAQDVKAATIYCETGATIPSTSLPDGCVVKGVIESESQFAAAMEKGGNYALLKDVDLAKRYDIYKTVALDLNQKTLTVASDIYAREDGVVTFENGKVVGKNGCGLNVATKGTLILDGIDFSGLGWSCVFILQNAQNTSLTIKNSKIQGGYYALSTNASTTPEVAKSCNMVLENSTFIASDTYNGTKTGTAAMINIAATVSMKDCSFTGYCQGALLRGGTYEIEGCTFNLSAELPSTDDGNKWMTAWETGNSCAYAALTVGNYLNTAYQYPTKITFTGTNKATVEGDYASSYPAMHVCANSAEGLGVTITNLSNITLTSGKTTTPEYGTTNITVDNTAVNPNVSTAN